MSNLQLFSFGIAGLASLCYIALAGYIAVRKELKVTRIWMALYCFWGVVLVILHILSIFEFRLYGFGTSIPLILASFISTALLGITTFSFLEYRLSYIWPAAAGVFAFLVLALEFSGILTTPMIGMAWRSAIFGEMPIIGITALFLWMFLGVTIFSNMLFALSRATLPLHANRLMWWALNVAFVGFSELGSTFLPNWLPIFGVLARLLSVIGLVYTASFTRLVDIRNFLRTFIGNGVLVAITSGIILMAIGVGQRVISDPALAGIRGLLVLIAFAIALAIIYQILRNIATGLIEQLVLRFGFDANRVISRYAQRIANVLEYDELARASTETLRSAVESRSGALLLFSTGSESTFIEVVPGLGTVETTPIEMRLSSAFLQVPARTRQPILQYNIDVDRKFRTLTDAERAWLKGLNADVFMPILDRNEMTGMLVCGSRLNGEPYRPRELNLMASIADQTAVALKNARLYDNRTRMLEEMRGLNEELQDTNERLEEIDSVKMDFLTIASHELRTPLTRVRGSADILDTLNQAGIMDQSQMSEIVNTMLRSCDRMEEVIGQMLDAAQIDVEAMELKFTETTMSAIIKQAIEPFTDAIRDRRQRLTVRGVSGLPSIFVDQVRLVQAARQIISNSIKYTPNGNEITITTFHVRETIEQPEAIKIEFRDTGVGIDPKYHDLIFDKFFRIGSVAVHSTSTTKFMGAGPGLGLPIAKGVIEGHGGKIWIESLGFDRDACPGTTVHVLIPVRPPKITSSSGYKVDLEAEAQSAESIDLEQELADLMSTG